MNNLTHWGQTVPQKVEAERNPDFDPSLSGDFAPSSLPALTDEVKELNSKINTIIRDFLKMNECEVLTVDLRRRLSTREFRAYITVASSIGLDNLHSIETVLRPRILHAQRIEISSFYWRYRAQPSGQ